MMIAFVGAPCSGKTTTAASSFALLKEYDVAAEFIPEHARWHIARKKQSPTDMVVLDDYDQREIMLGQLHDEATMLRACGDEVVLVCDSSALNSLAYMSEAARQYDDIQKMIAKAISHYDFVFFCPRVKVPRAVDPNRLHSEEDSKRIEESLEQIINECCPGLEMIKLYGDAKTRPTTVVSHVLGNL